MPLYYTKRVEQRLLAPQIHTFFLLFLLCSYYHLNRGTFCPADIVTYWKILMGNIFIALF